MIVASWRSDPNSWVAVFTGLLAVVASIQAWLFVSQLKLMRRSSEDSTIAANAARQSADIATNTERAWVITDVTFSSDLPDLAGQGGPKRSVMIVTVKNAGRSPAEIEKTQIVSVLLPADVVMPDEPFYLNSDAAFAIRAIPGEIIPAGEKILIWSPIRDIALLSEQHWLEIRSGVSKLYCYGKILYKDLSGTQRLTQFGYAFYVKKDSTDGRPDAMYRIEERKYNYTI